MFSPSRERRIISFSRSLHLSPLLELAWPQETSVSKCPNTPHQRIVDPIFVQYEKLFRSLVRHNLICHADDALLVPNRTSYCRDNFGGRFTYRASNTFTGCPSADGADTYGTVASNRPFLSRDNLSGSILSKTAKQVARYRGATFDQSC